MSAGRGSVGTAKFVQIQVVPLFAGPGIYALDGAGRVWRYYEAEKEWVAVPMDRKET